jgi:hypothetical protein
MDFRRLFNKYKGNGKVRNYSSRELWVLETDTNDPKGPPIAHRLLPQQKTPIKFDIDAFRRLDNKPIDGHSSWWKIFGYTTADISDKGDLIAIDVLARVKANDDRFGGEIVYENSGTWGDPIQKVTKVERNKSGAIKKYYVENQGWLTKHQALKLAAKGLIDNVVIVQPKSGKPYLRALPDSQGKNNLRELPS